MQKDNPDTPKIRQIKRVRKTSTPDLVRRNVPDSTTNIRTGMSHHRTTMAPSDFSSLKNFPKRKIIMERASMMPSQVQLDATQVMDPECNDTELKLLYDEYLQNIMTEIILKKKTEETQKLIISQLATIVKECDDNKEILFKLKARERDINSLSKLQNDIDSQIVDVNNCPKCEDIKKLEDILSKLYSILRPLDMLRCNNMILPETSEKWTETINALKTCSNVLKSIMDLIGTKNELYKSVNNGIKEFLGTYSHIEDHQKRLEKELCNLQALVLKNASLTLTQNDN